jgi:hypothetical protein
MNDLKLKNALIMTFRFLLERLLVHNQGGWSICIIKTKMNLSMDLLINQGRYFRMITIKRRMITTKSLIDAQLCL